jgi:hypothetical protein
MAVGTNQQNEMKVTLLNRQSIELHLNRSSKQESHQAVSDNAVRRTINPNSVGAISWPWLAAEMAVDFAGVVGEVVEALRVTIELEFSSASPREPFVREWSMYLPWKNAFEESVRHLNLGVTIHLPCPTTHRPGKAAKSYPEMTELQFFPSASTGPIDIASCRILKTLLVLLISRPDPAAAEILLCDGKLNPTLKAFPHGKYPTKVSPESEGCRTDCMPSLSKSAETVAIGLSKYQSEAQRRETRSSHPIMLLLPLSNSTTKSF